jgi:hypothetical protein
MMSLPTGARNGDTHVAGSFNVLVAPNAGGFFTGDHEGLRLRDSGRIEARSGEEAPAPSAAGPADSRS